MQFFSLVINSDLGPIWYRLAATARNDFQGHQKSMIFILFERAYDGTYWY